MEYISSFAYEHPVIFLFIGACVVIGILPLLRKVLVDGTLNTFRRMDWSFNPQRYCNLDGQQIIRPEVADMVFREKKELTRDMLSIPFPDDYEFPGANFPLFYNNAPKGVNRAAVAMTPTHKALGNKKCYARFYAWRLIHTNMSDAMMEQFALALAKGVYLMDELDEYKAYNENQIKFLQLSCGYKEYYKMVRKDWTNEQWLAICDEFANYTIRHPVFVRVYFSYVLHVLAEYIFEDGFLIDRIFPSYSFIYDQGYFSLRERYKSVFYRMREIKEMCDGYYREDTALNCEKDDFLREFRKSLVGA